MKLWKFQNYEHGLGFKPATNHAKTHTGMICCRSSRVAVAMPIREFWSHGTVGGVRSFLYGWTSECVKILLLLMEVLLMC